MVLAVEWLQSGFRWYVRVGYWSVSDELFNEVDEPGDRGDALVREEAVYDHDMVSRVVVSIYCLVEEAQAR